MSSKKIREMEAELEREKKKESNSNAIWILGLLFLAPFFHIIILVVGGLVALAITYKFVKWVATLKVDVDSSPKTVGRHPLIEAVIKNDIKSVRDEVSARGSVNIVSNGVTPLIAASAKGYVNIVTLLIDAGANVNFVYKGDGNTPLMAAAHEGHADVVEVLLRAGADLSICNLDGADAIQIANEQGHDSVVEVITQFDDDSDFGEEDHGGEANDLNEKAPSIGVQESQSPYEILEISKSASAQEIDQAYRKMAKHYHPDLVATMAPAFRELAENKMKEINSAYKALKKRSAA